MGTREEFVDGFSALKAFTLKDIKKACEKECKNIATSEIQFDKFYVWLYNFVKENPDKRSIPKDTAMQLWKVILDNKKDYPLSDDFLDFVGNHKDTKAITSDTWKNVRKFLKQCKKIDGFENDGAWPILVDEYLDERQG